MCLTENDDLDYSGLMSEVAFALLGEPTSTVVASGATGDTARLASICTKMFITTMKPGRADVFAI
jgi:hypothetical protein